ncbi:hypothetical protein BP6252_08217 [Coleophoma cylindrospora]|uniref:Rhodopsin domain-containing protein n=1 Tax=Coleophoma cylindrospora TaxID=1849047 RepID=A0A3D8R5C3_9HELO|nr:hypothetical protein BP6252_08217 [Coleophoma cylindrospora]
MLEEGGAMGVECTLCALALVVIALRIFVRLFILRQSLRISDYFAIMGWLCAAAETICHSITFKAGILKYVDPNLPPLESLMKASDSSASRVMHADIYRSKANFASLIFLEVGIYFPKASILALYWSIIPPFLESLRKTLIVITGLTGASALSALLVDLLWCNPISNNWSPDFHKCAVFTLIDPFIVNWSINFATDLLIFVFPFLLIGHLNLRKHQGWAFKGTLSLGAITILISVARFTYIFKTILVVPDDIWCVAELSTATMVVSLPTLKPLVFESRDKGNMSKESRSIPSSTGYNRGCEIPDSNIFMIGDSRIENLTQRQ